MSLRRTTKTRRQAAAIPIRGGARPKVCLIRRKGADNWGIPKGFIDRGWSAEEAALTEADEEAGLSGRILGDVVGRYSYTKRGNAHSVAVFLMEVLEEGESWQEMGFRERRWFTLKQAGAALTGHPVARLWDRVLERVDRRRD